MTELVIRYCGEPIPQNQGKIGRWRAKDGREGATIRQPAKVKHYKLDIQELMYRAARDAGWPQDAGHDSQYPFFRAQPLALSIVAVFPCPISDYRKTKPVPRRPHVGRYGNLDNLIKPIGDAGEGVLWLDDGQICRYYEPFEKWIGAQGEAPYIEIRVRPLADLTSARGTAPMQPSPNARPRDSDPLPALRSQERPVPDPTQGGAPGGGEDGLAADSFRAPGEPLQREVSPGLFDELPEHLK